MRRIAVGNLLYNCINKRLGSVGIKSNFQDTASIRYNGTCNDTVNHQITALCKIAKSTCVGKQVFNNSAIMTH